MLSSSSYARLLKDKRIETLGNNIDNMLENDDFLNRYEFENKFGNLDHNR